MNRNILIIGLVAIVILGFIIAPKYLGDDLATTEAGDSMMYGKAMFKTEDGTLVEPVTNPLLILSGPTVVSELTYELRVAVESSEHDYAHVDLNQMGVTYWLVTDGGSISSSTNILNTATHNPPPDAVTGTGIMEIDTGVYQINTHSSSPSWETAYKLIDPDEEYVNLLGLFGVYTPGIDIPLGDYDLYVGPPPSSDIIKYRAADEILPWKTYDTEGNLVVGPIDVSWDPDDTTITAYPSDGAN